jgi:hypothetical protein
MKLYPAERAAQLAEQAAAFVRRTSPKCIEFSTVRSIADIEATCAAAKIYVRKGETLPPNVSAISMQVAGSPFIVVSKDVRVRADEREVLAHELAHHLLNHCTGPSQAVLGFAGTMDSMNETLQRLYGIEIELEADLLGMMLVIPDELLHAIVREKLWIPTKQIARDNGLRVAWTAARVELYRLMYGWGESEKLLRSRATRPMDGISRDPSRCRINELADCEGIREFLPALPSELGAFRGFR